MSTAQIRYNSKMMIDKATAYADREIKKMVDDVIYRLSFIGEKAVAIARDRGNYHNKTGNLRSSIGYVVLHDGEPVSESESKIYGSDVEGSSDQGTHGDEVGKDFLDQLKNSYPHGIVLIVSAGMNYASYVEDIHGLDVLTSSQLEAERLAEKLLKQLFE